MRQMTRLLDGDWYWEYIFTSGLAVPIWNMSLVHPEALIPKSIVPSGFRGIGLDLSESARDIGVGLPELVKCIVTVLTEF